MIFLTEIKKKIGTMVINFIYLDPDDGYDGRSGKGNSRV